MGDIFEENVKVYPSLTRAFYAAALIEWDWMEIVDMSKEEVGKALFSNKKMSTKVRDLTNLAKLLFNIVSKTLIPRNGFYEKLYPSDLLTTFHLIVGRKINLPRIILSHMAYSLATNLQSSLVYPMIMTKVFEYFDVPLAGEEISDESRKYLSEKSLSTMKIGGSAPPVPQSLLPTPPSSPIPHPLHQHNSSHLKNQIHVAQETEVVVTSPQRTLTEENHEKVVEKEKVITEKQDEEKKEDEEGNRQDEENLYLDDPDTQVAKVLPELKASSDLASPGEEELEPIIEASSEEQGTPATTSTLSEKDSSHQETDAAPHLL
ncbi:hypothetical protein SESBI_34063 [Sesbania bispinosa]|nr:hypothetical protein SESBI_34063 [Sesbania bispinosa]